MSKKLTLIALSLIASGAAMAQGLSREQVAAELQAARASGQLQLLNSENPDAAGRGQIAASGKASALSRATVLNELQHARASGELARVDSESYGPSVAPVASTKTRAEVMAELQRARASGEIEAINGERSEHAQLAALKAHQQPAQVLAGQPATAQ
ncbi:DUF4148 domain-containing protein [Roseateles sp. DAIF2]|uniref:DUF4148 domain-containing protein n=1 Tax=Roseateles sp. DAIF2 TaxID=2714952 RepID=UPI0018A2B106|nr:DUF4148 domain-containing protein [Roseateles sp. DAIF2]QPF74435.1 DUF4148 domain-containing protein [Roseateles sp. DAIF2]